VQGYRKEAEVDRTIELLSTTMSHTDRRKAIVAIGDGDFTAGPIYWQLADVRREGSMHQDIQGGCRDRNRQLRG
jgi:hypothetical protein